LRKLTFSYVLAWALVVLLLVTALLGGVIKPHPIDPTHKINLKKDPDPAITKMTSPPFAPDKSFWLGTDLRGYDMLILILNGMKYTLGYALFITICRFLVALPIGLLSGGTGKGRTALSALQWITSAVPPILFIFPPLFGMYRGLGLQNSLTATSSSQQMFGIMFIALVIFIGVFPLAFQVRERARYYNDKLFVTASGIMGASLWHKIRTHLLPNMRMELLFAFLAEYVQVLFLMGQLAVLGVFLGGGETLDLDDYGLQMSLTTTGEWCALIAYSADTRTIRLYPWIVLSVGFFYTGSILIIQNFLTQLKLRGTPVE
jgi:ABC-type dipeptide/oligopeptide/nickel transport system permease subunit